MLRYQTNGEGIFWSGCSHGNPQQHGAEWDRLRRKAHLGPGGWESMRPLGFWGWASTLGTQRKDGRWARRNNNVLLEAGGRILLRKNSSVSQDSVVRKKPQDMAWKVEEKNITVLHKLVSHFEFLDSERRVIIKGALQNGESLSSKQKMVEFPV